MLCPNCHGAHFVMLNGQPAPCPECGGLGEIHCCDGLTEQPDNDCSPEPQPSTPCRIRRDADGPDGE